MNICTLCQKETKLELSHIIPKFVGKWLKDTSVTGYLRRSISPNQRTQDLIKIKLLCRECEKLFSKWETDFANNIFYPYVFSELDEWGIAQGQLGSIRYKEWLLKFAVSLQWRNLMIADPITEFAGLCDQSKNHYSELLIKIAEKWRLYLLGEKNTSGEERHYLILLQNLMAGKGWLPPNLSPQVNTYLLRSADSTLAISEKSIFIYTKLGPMVLITGIKPSSFKGMNDALIRKKGEFKTTQSLLNTFVNQFIFVTRPNEALITHKISDAQNKKIEKDISQKYESSKHKNSVLASYSDFLMKNRTGNS